MCSPWGFFWFSHIFHNEKKNLNLTEPFSAEVTTGLLKPAEQQEESAITEY